MENIKNSYALPQKVGKKKLRSAPKARLLHGRWNGYGSIRLKKKTYERNNVLTNHNIEQKSIIVYVSCIASRIITFF